MRALYDSYSLKTELLTPQHMRYTMSNICEGTSVAAHGNVSLPRHIYRLRLLHACSLD